MAVPDNRNMVLFPQRFGGMYVRLERPFAYCYHGTIRPYDIWLSDSPDCRYWGNSRLLFRHEEVPWCNDKIGPAAPPVKTEAGWLTLFHIVDRDDSRKGWGWEGNWTKRYTAGIMLLDLDNPSKVIGISRELLLVPEPEYLYEAKGYRDYVIFPAWILWKEKSLILKKRHIETILAVFLPVILTYHSPPVVRLFILGNRLPPENISLKEYQSSRNRVILSFR